MASTTWVQFLKGGLLIIFSIILVGAVLVRGISTEPDQGGQVPFYEYQQLTATRTDDGLTVTEPGWQVVQEQEIKAGLVFVQLRGESGGTSWWNAHEGEDQVVLNETQWVETVDGQKWINGAAASDDNTLRQVGNLQRVNGEAPVETGSILNPLEFLATMTADDSIVRLWKPATVTTDSGDKVTVYYWSDVSGEKVMRPGLRFKVEGTPLERLDFLSLMLALFLAPQPCPTSSSAITRSPTLRPHASPPSWPSPPSGSSTS